MMLNFDRGVLWLIMGVGIAMAAVLANQFLSPSARIERRRRRSNSRIVSRARRPMVKFSVHTGHK